MNARIATALLAVRNLMRRDGSSLRPYGGGNGSVDDATHVPCARSD
jgi:hypothetical protein